MLGALVMSFSDILLICF